MRELACSRDWASIFRSANFDNFNVEVGVFAHQMSNSDKNN
jgi:hypothetical protein